MGIPGSFGFAGQPVDGSEDGLGDDGTGVDGERFAGFSGGFGIVVVFEREAGEEFLGFEKFGIGFDGLAGQLFGGAIILIGGQKSETEQCAGVGLVNLEDFFEEVGSDAEFVAAATAPDADNAEGRLAASFTVVRLGANAAASKDPAKKALLEKKEGLEQAIDQLKYEKASMNAEDYKKQLTRLLVELAKTQEEIDK